MSIENEKVEIDKDSLSVISITTIIAVQKIAQLTGESMEYWMHSLTNFAEKQLQEIKRTRPEQIDEIIEKHKEIFPPDEAT